jgi:hypothetical protein
MLRTFRNLFDRFVGFVATYDTAGALCLVEIPFHRRILCWIWNGSLPAGVPTYATMLTQSWACSIICCTPAADHAARMCLRGRGGPSVINNGSTVSVLFHQTYRLALTFPVAFFVKIQTIFFPHECLIQYPTSCFPGVLLYSSTSIIRTTWVEGWTVFKKFVTPYSNM